MACFYPMDAVRFVDGTVKVIGTLANGKHSRKWDYMDVKEYLQVPCGKCLGCKLEYSRQWAIRCMNELETTKGQSWFITLTYDDDHLPRIPIILQPSGNILEKTTLKPKDLQDFIKALRERKRRVGEEDIRFFACGEYGDEGKRPHYHAIIYNLNLDDLKFKFFKNGHSYYTSEYISSIWQKGIITVSDVNFECCAYVARYMLKKHKDSDHVWSYASDNGIIGEFTRMSRRPGIGREWYELHKDSMYKNDSQIIRNKNGSLVLQPAKYYDKLFDVDNPVRMDDIKERRKHKAENRERLLLSKTTVSSIDYRGILMREKEQKIKLLKRDFETKGSFF